MSIGKRTVKAREGIDPAKDYPLDEAVKLANDTVYGLAAYVFTNDLTVMWKMAEGLEAGIIGMNDPVPATPQCPFGAVDSHRCPTMHARRFGCSSSSRRNRTRASSVTCGRCRR